MNIQNISCSSPCLCIYSFRHAQFPLRRDLGHAISTGLGTNFLSEKKESFQLVRYIHKIPLPTEQSFLTLCYYNSRQKVKQ